MVRAAEHCGRTRDVRDIGAPQAGVAKEGNKGGKTENRHAEEGSPLKRGGVDGACAQTWVIRASVQSQKKNIYRLLQVEY